MDTCHPHHETQVYIDKILSTAQRCQWSLTNLKSDFSDLWKILIKVIQHEENSVTILELVISSQVNTVTCYLRK